ncbi:MAG: biosynthetic peptidoglycan transglycosylase [Treponemataceae bacterium]
MSRPPRIVVAFDPGAAAFAVITAARNTAITRPFGTDTLARLITFIVLNFNGSPHSKLRNSQRSKPWRVVFGFLRIIVLTHIAFLVATSFCLFVFKSTNPATTTLMVYRAQVNKWKIAKPRFVPLAKIPKATRNMTVRVEDGNFFNHFGIDPAAIKHAYKLNKGFHAPLYGGSTITMQTARTIFLIPEKSYLRKYLEAIIALEMEVILGKNRILELYFNYAEWGRGIFGIEAASRFHYQEGVNALSSDQAIRLVTLLSSPIRFSPYSFGRNGILWSRYAYLNKRWGEQAAEPMEEPVALQSASPVAESALAPVAEPIEGVPLSTGGEAEIETTAEAESGPTEPESDGGVVTPVVGPTSSGIAP